MAITTSKYGAETSKYVLVGSDDEAAPVETTPSSPTGASKEEEEEEEEGKEDGAETKCPEVLYKVQFKDFSGEIKGTRELSAPYKLKKTTYGGSGIPIIELLYTVTIWYPQIYRKGKGLEKKELDDDSAKENFDERSMDEKEMIIHSQPIITALREIVDYYPGQSLVGETITIKDPFAILIHYRKELQEYKHKCDNEQTIQHLDVLQKYMDDNMGAKIQDEDKNHAKPTPACTFDMLWMLYKPGTDVYATIDNERAGLVVQSVANVTENSKWGHPQPLKIHMWHLDFDGTVCGRRPYEMVIAPFEGEREITSLKIVPSHYVDAIDPTQRKRLENRGAKFYGMLLGQQMDYKGYSLIAKQKPKRFLEARVVVDQSAFYTYADYNETDLHPSPMLGVDDENTGTLQLDHYNCSCEECNNKRQAAVANSKFANYEALDPNNIKSLEMIKDNVVSRHRYFLLPRRIMGFDLKEKKWQALDVECCHEPKFATDAIDNLVLPTDKLDLVKALVYKYTTASKAAAASEDTWSADYISGKGKGQVFLLHGPPGAGKTFTAESVAEYTSRPLLALTCGDLGTDESGLEWNLTKWFKLGEKWRCVLLLDEADVYLERRSTHELKRNGLVSIFLRALEYYKGILFLTTNRVGMFDPAILSRIHVYIGYRPLDKEGRKALWLQNFSKLERERGDQIVIKTAAKRYIMSDDVLEDTNLNGREIRNSFQTAVALAEYEAEHKAVKPVGQGHEKPTKEGEGEAAMVQIELNQSHFVKVMEMHEGFKRYLSSVEPVNAESHARVAGERGDDDLL